MFQWNTKTMSYFPDQCNKQGKRLCFTCLNLDEQQQSQSLPLSSFNH